MSSATGGKRPRLDRTSAVRLAIVVGLVVLVLAAWTWRVAGEERTHRYLETTDEIQAEYTQTIGDLNAVVADFSGDPASAAEAGAALRDQSAKFTEIRDRLDEVSAPAEAEAYHASLCSLYAQYGQWCDELEQVATYIERRAAILNGLSSAIETFDQQVAASESNDAVIAASRTLKTACDTSLTELRALGRPQLLSYSSAMIETNIIDLAAYAEQLADAVEELDAARVSASVTQLRGVLTRDWALAVQESDVEGTERFRQTQADLQAQEQAVLTERAAIALR